MSLTSLASIATDLIALALLIGALYLPRHGRKDLLAAYIGINVGVLAVTLLLATATISAGLGLGLFGVLSIIRLRSTEISQHEIAYFFAALALGLLGGIGASIAVTSLLMGLVVASLWIGDHPALVRRNRHQVVMLDRAIADERALIAHLEKLLGGTVRSLEVQRLDLVNDTTLVDVRYRLHRSPVPAGEPAGRAESAAGALPASPEASPLDEWYRPQGAAQMPVSYQPQHAVAR
ncbi:MAG: DUF4956 domain-containing protein [Actinomyces sp.]|uniref:DUF4956 domain-containing protein n=1 Tax=Actinomyces sp. TaxID=29317 RepID=UPI0026DC38AC|nr:DUF4956 domain-containing protein [Actinomyces sp.]MDO4243632.1 DUF4956 domain-containing protein [Actinomyces sp.]